MIFLPIFILALIQGITEFLPISSSGHLVLAHYFMDDNASALNQKRLDIAVHLGTLFAVIIYFRKDFVDLICGGIYLITGRYNRIPAYKAQIIIIASIPVIIAGFILYLFDMTYFDSLYILAWSTIIFGILLYIADRNIENSKSIEEFTRKSALFYGLMQVLALIPGVSRSGITMTAGRFLNHSRVEAARFSMMMGMVTITAASVLIGVDVFRDQSITTDFLFILMVGIIASFIAAYITIFFMMRWFQSSGSMIPFVLYRIVLGGTLLALLYSGIIA